MMWLIPNNLSYIYSHKTKINAVFSKKKGKPHDFLLLPRCKDYENTAVKMCIMLFSMDGCRADTNLTLEGAVIIYRVPTSRENLEKVRNPISFFKALKR